MSNIPRYQSLFKSPERNPEIIYPTSTSQGKQSKNPVQHLLNEKYPFTPKQSQNPSGMSQSSVFFDHHETKTKMVIKQQSVCSPVLSLLNRCKFLDRLVQKSKQIIHEKNEKIKFLLLLLEERDDALKEFHYQNIKLKEERHILIEQIAQLEYQLNEDEEIRYLIFQILGSQDASYQPRMSDLTDLRHFFHQIRIQTDSLPVFIDQQDMIDVDNMTYEQLLSLEDHIGYVNRGLQKDQIKLIPKIQYNSMSQDMQESDPLCSICQQDYLTNDVCRKLNCQHLYHSKCIKQWLGNEKYCPICKTEQIISIEENLQNQLI